MNKEAVKQVSFNENTSKNYIINAATIYTNLTHSAGTGFEGEPHGATSGGVSLSVEIEYRDVEIDGAGYTPVKGNKILQRAEATATGNVKEIIAETIRRSLNGTITEATEGEAPTGYKVVTPKAKLDDTDYLTNVAIVGTLSGTDEPVVAVLDNAICTSGLTMETADDDEAVIEQVYQATADHGQLAKREIPFRMFFPTIV